MTLSDAILSVLTTSNSFFSEDGGDRFEALTQTDLMAALQEKGWKLPYAGAFLYEVRRAGFQARQGYQFAKKIRRVSRDGTPGKALSQYQTIIFL